MPRLPWVLLVLLTGFGWVAPAQASTWNRIAEFTQIIQTTGVEALVANDCPGWPVGGLHDRRQVILLCGNNLPDDPAPGVGGVAHEQLLRDAVLQGWAPVAPSTCSARARRQRRQQPDAFQDLSLYGHGSPPCEAGLTWWPCHRTGSGSVFNLLRVPNYGRSWFCIGMPGCWRWC